MDIILTQDVDELGVKGTVVTVKNGYGRNYLIPRGMAVVANKGNRARFEEEARQASHKIEKAREDASKLKDRLDETEIVIPARVGEEGRLFGTVTTQQVADALIERGFEIDRRKVSIEDIRQTGVYTATVKLHPEFSASPKVKVVPEEESL